LIILIILGEQYKLWSSSLCSFLQPPITSSHSTGMPVVCRWLQDYKLYWLQVHTRILSVHDIKWCLFTPYVHQVFHKVVSTLQGIKLM
jgi:hypothetical protein